MHLTLNILIKNNEFEEAVNLAKFACESGIDAIIVQDMGLATYLINNFPDLPIHASTQMTCHNLDGAKYLEAKGFKRIVLSRELSLSEIDYIKSNVDTEIEVFAHGALCISYSGQCLYSSLIGGRSGNRGKCAQGCRLPYELIENEHLIDKGYLLSPRDLCSLELLPELLNTNIDSLKIEGRMKSAEYVATVTRIYRKYIDKIINNESYVIEPQDKKDLLQVFNRGNFSTGHLEDSPNKELIYKEKPNHHGIYVGNVSNYNKSKGYITFTLNDELSIGDTITFEKEPTTYRISELMSNNKNMEYCNSKIKITIGRMKGNINIGDKIYKLASKKLSKEALDSYSKEYIKTPLKCILDLHLNQNMKLTVVDNNNLSVKVDIDEFPVQAIKNPISRERLKEQLNKTTNTPFVFRKIEINMDENLYIPHISSINELRRLALDKYSSLIINKYKRKTNFKFKENENKEFIHNKNTICILLNTLNLDYDYSKLEDIDKVYIPLKYFSINKYNSILKTLSNKFNLYIYMPNIFKTNYNNIFKNIIDDSLKLYKIKGFVISNIGELELLKDYKEDFEFIGNYTLNVFNNYTISSLDLDSYTISPELNKDEVNNICKNAESNLELIVYGRVPLMTSNYCLLGNSNKCYPECKKYCNNENKYYLKDRMNFKFRVVPDNIQTITTIFNSKINSIDTHEINIDNLRIDILDENINEINNIVNVVKNYNKLEGIDYTNGNLNRIV